MTDSNNEFIPLQKSYDSLFEGGSIFIEESIKTPQKKLICDIEGLLDISSEKYDIKSYLEREEVDSEELAHLAEQFEYINHLDFIRKLIISKSRISWLDGSFSCNLNGHDFAGAHKDFESIILFLLASCIDSINKNKSVKFEEWLSKKIKKDNGFSIKSCEDLKNNIEEYKKDTESLSHTFQNSFTQLSDELKDEWVTHYSVVPDGENKIDRSESDEFWNKVKSDHEAFSLSDANSDEKNEKLRKIARFIYKMRSSFTHNSKRFFECNCPIDHQEPPVGKFLVQFGKKSLIEMLKSTIICLAKNKYLPQIKEKI